MSTEKTSIENESQPSCLGGVSGWVALSERQPTIEADGEKILVYRIMNDSQKSLSITVYDTYSTKFCDKNETWWMQLPKPPCH